MTKTTLLKSSLLSIALASSAIAIADGEATYKDACAVCHTAGIAGAPKLGDKEAWTARIATGNDALYEVALKGKGAMPAKGGRTELSDDDVKAVVDYMVAQSK
ncbi:MAG: c-type cytochrome [Cocleimonas sp.]